MMTKYVAGFLFDYDYKKVALIRKKKPEWQAGRLNAIGGKVEHAEACLVAMIREFFEETGSKIYGWRPFCTLSGEDWIVHFYEAQGSLEELHSVTDEHIEVWDVESVKGFDETVMIPNLAWLVPMAMDGVFANVS